MNVKRHIFLGIFLGLGLFLFSFEGEAGQSVDAVSPSTTLDSGSSETDQTIGKSSLAPGQTETTPNAVAVDKIFEFEPVLEGKTVTHTFKIKNTGETELKILKVRTG